MDGTIMRRAENAEGRSEREEDYLKATVGEPEFYKVCTAAFV